MNKTTQAEYKAELDQAGEMWDESGGEPMSEAERLAALAQVPKKRIDGLPVAGEHKRGQPLTLSQQRFIEGVIRGQSLRSSYRQAYENDTGSDASISGSASRLMKDPRVQEALQAAWGETVEHLIDDMAASKRFVLKGLLHLVKTAKVEASQLRALELMGKACGLFTPVEIIDKAPITADQLKRELASHLKMLAGHRSSVDDVHPV